MSEHSIINTAYITISLFDHVVILLGQPYH